jgi:putative FmdB family regulatory protein
MPLFDFHCESCGLTKECYVSSHEKETLVCQCGKTAKKIKKSYPSVLKFMDSGFHATDYPNK